jgi:hypothetical protein
MARLARDASNLGDPSFEMRESFRLADNLPHHSSATCAIGMNSP